MIYTVRSVVSDYGVFQITDTCEQLIDICNSLANAKLIANILNTDAKNNKYEVIEKSKIDDAVERIKQEIQNGTIKITCGNDLLFKILKNIGE